MAATNFTPISLYYSTTASAVPTAANLVPGELAINTNDGKLYYEDSAGVVQVLASKATSSGTFGAISATSITNSGLTTGRVVYTTTGGLETSSATLTYDGTTLTATTGANFGTTSGSVGIGTASPTKKLTVSTNTSTDGILITGSTNPRLQVIDTTNSVTLELISGDSQATIRTDTNHPIVFGTNGTERMQINAGAPILCLSGGSTTATGTGIAFPATQSASSDANTLDDYEEGTWTPSVGGTATYGSNQFGYYTKVGNIVTCQFAIEIATLGTGSTSLLSGFPFTSANSPGGHAGCVGYYGSLAVNTIYLNFYVNSSNTTATFNGKSILGATMDNSIALFGNGTRVGGSITYKIA